MANFYTEIPELKFHLNNSMMERICELKERGYKDKDEFDYFCIALLFTICSKNLSNDDQELILSGFKYSEYAKIKVNYYIEYFNLDSSCPVDDLEINSLTNALLDSVNTDFDPSSINHYVVILDFKNMMADIIKMYS